MQAYKFPTFTGCVQHTYRTEGTLGFWRGVTAPLASITLVRTVSFSIYQKAKYTYSAWFERATGSAPLVVANTPGNFPTFSTVTCFGAAGATAGGIITLIACPFELTKLSAQISVLMAKTSATSVDDPIRRSYQQLGTFKTAKNIVKHRGVMGLYSGFHLHLLRDTIGTAVYFMTYESGKQMLATYGGGSPTSPLAVVTAGGLCGIVSWACVSRHADETSAFTSWLSDYTDSKLDISDRLCEEHLPEELSNSQQITTDTDTKDPVLQ
ncbi:MAG: hypothetical protein M1840_006170 [Geoglossum simile]|nr:MAG: hypothetical protein M1840_006170 [Geoglossum simile]